MSEENWSFEVLDEHGKTSTIGDLLSTSWNLMVMLRHGECIECNMLMYELKSLHLHLQEWGVALMLVGYQEPNKLARIRERLHLDPTVRLVTNPSQSIHRQLQLHSGFLGAFGPKALYNIVRGLFDGHVQTNFLGYHPQQSGLVLLDPQKQIKWKHRSTHLGDIPTSGQILAEILRFVSGPSGGAS